MEVEPASTTAVDVVDDPALLDLMMSDARGAPECYRPTNYWAYYERQFLPYLRSHGLHDFRRAGFRGPEAVFHSFGATDPADPAASIRRLDHSRLINNRLTRRFPSLIQAAAQASKAIERRVVRSDLASHRQLCYEFARRQGELATHAIGLEHFSGSVAGNPEDAFDVDGRTYTRLLLYYYLRYVYVSRFVDLGDMSTLAELGPGGGKQAEVIHKLHPNLTLLLFDIPPQLYVCHQYLSAVFPHDVVDYRTTRTVTPGQPMQPGKIHIFGNWQFELLARQRTDLFWNAASLQEMEPDVVSNYLRAVNQVATAAYLMEAMEGQERASRSGGPGVLQQTTLADYRRGLGDFALVNMSDALLPNAEHMPRYSDSFWSRTPES